MSSILCPFAACSRKGAKYLKDMPGMKLRRQPGPPAALSWVHTAVWKVDPRWKPYIGDLSWHDIEQKLKNASSKKRGRGKGGKGKGKPQKNDAHPAAGGQELEMTSEAHMSEEAAEYVIAAYTGGLEENADAFTQS